MVKNPAIWWEAHYLELFTSIAEQLMYLGHPRTEQSLVVRKGFQHTIYTEGGYSPCVEISKLLFNTLTSSQQLLCECVEKASQRIYIFELSRYVNYYPSKSCGTNCYSPLFLNFSKVVPCIFFVRYFQGKKTWI